MAKIGQKVKGNPFTFWPILAIFWDVWLLAKNAQKGQFRPGENDFLIAEGIEVHFEAFSGHFIFCLFYAII